MTACVIMLAVAIVVVTLLERQRRVWRRRCAEMEQACRDANRAGHTYLWRAERAEAALAEQQEPKKQDNTDVVNDFRKFDVRGGGTVTIERFEVRKVQELSNGLVRVFTAERGCFVVMGNYDEVRGWSLTRE